MKVQQIIGVDLSKRTIDLVCHSLGTHIKIENSISGFQQFTRWLRQLQINSSELMVVMEHTGLYSLQFENYLQKHQIGFTKVSALAIKRSLGLIRGKTDKIDAFRIAAYGYEKMERLTVDLPVSQNLKRLQMLHATRDRLVRQRAALVCAIKEYRHIGLSEKDLLVQSQLRVIKTYDQEIKRLECETEKVISVDEKLRKNYDLLRTIKGVGKVLALATIIKTNNFQKFANSRKFACFCGTAPFEHSSGTSIKGKTRVSHLADKQMKSLLDLSAKTAIQYDPELRNYYLNRTAKGKSKMSSINIIRNKIVYRMFAVVKRQTPYMKDYNYKAA